MDQAARAYHQAFERARNKFERKHRDSIGRALFLTVEDFKKAVQEKALVLEQALPLVDSEITDLHISAAYKKLYEEVVVFFATSTQRSLEERTKKEVKVTAFISWVSDFIKTNGAARIVGITASLKKDISSVLEAAIKSGLSIPNTMELFEKRRIGFEPYRAARIARTEIISASNYGSREGAKATGFKLQKEWISTQSPRTRTIPKDAFDHLEMDGKLAAFDEPFKVPTRGGGFEEMDIPGDHRGSAANVINCRCTVAWIPVKD